MKVAINGDYLHASDALKDHGWKFLGQVDGWPDRLGRSKSYHVYAHPETFKPYYFKSMDHYNTTIYSITMLPYKEDMGSRKISGIESAFKRL